MSTAKMRIRMGTIEIDYEGSEDFLKQELPAILNAVSTLYKDSGLIGNGPQATNEPRTGQPVGGSKATISVTTIAAKLSAKSGGDLVLAAAARLTRSGADTFSRAKLLEEMKAATGYYKSTFSSNLSNYLLTAVKESKLQETAKDTYSLSTNTRTEIDAKLGG